MRLPAFCYFPVFILHFPSITHHSVPGAYTEKHTVIHEELLQSNDIYRDVYQSQQEGVSING